MTGVDVVIIIAGIVGLCVAAYGLLTLTVQACRRRAYVEVAVAVLVAAGTVTLLLAFGDRLIR